MAESTKQYSILLDVSLTRNEIAHLATYNRECETRYAEMREYEMAKEHYERGLQFSGLMKTGWYLTPPSAWKEK